MNLFGITGVWVILIALVVVRISHWWYRWSNPKSNNGKLPPGSMGFPIIGETFGFFKPYGFYDISPFLKKKILRYGPMFRTNILGVNTMVSTEADVNMEILRQENESFVFSYPGGLAKSLGKYSLFFKTGNIHKHIKQISLHLLGSNNLKHKILKDMDRATREHLSFKASQGRLDVRETVSSLITAYLTPNVINNLEPETQAKLMDYFNAFNFDWFQTSFTLSAARGLYNTFRSFKEGMPVVRDVYMKRKTSREKYDDFLDKAIEEVEKKGSSVNEDEIVSLIVSLSSVSQELTSKATSLAVKFLSENPKVILELKREHEAILRSREDKKGRVTWEEYRHKMTFTNMGKELRSGSKNFMVFGGGIRQCSGAEFARLQMSIFLHHLVTTYEISLSKNCEIIRVPGAHFLNGISINISKCIE
ncbi:unnamed protein product [Cochlearia groenlandica]